MQKIRTCLDCGDSFESINSGNRICPQCKDRHERLISRGDGDYIYYTLLSLKEEAEFRVTHRQRVP